MILIVVIDLKIFKDHVTYHISRGMSFLDIWEVKGGISVSNVLSKARMLCHFHIKFVNKHQVPISNKLVRISHQKSFIRQRYSNLETQ